MPCYLSSVCLGLRQYLNNWQTSNLAGRKQIEQTGPTLLIIPLQLLCSLNICTTYEEALVLHKNQVSPPSMDHGVNIGANILPGNSICLDTLLVDNVIFLGTYNQV